MHSGEVAGALGQRKGRREEGRENPKDPEGREGREAQDGNRGYLQHCPGLRSGWRSQPWRWSPPPRPVPSATRAWPWPAPPPRSVYAAPAGRLGAPQPGREVTLSRLLAGAGGVMRPRAGWARGGRGPSRRGRPGRWVGAWAAPGCGLAKLAEPEGKGRRRTDLF